VSNTCCSIVNRFVVQFIHVIKHFFHIHGCSLRIRKKECLYLARYLQPSLIFASKAKAYPMFVERKVHYSALFINLVGWDAGAVSFPQSDVILAQLACLLGDIKFWLHWGITNLSLYKHLAYLSGALLVMVLASPVSIRLGCEGLPGNNTLGYLFWVSVAKEEETFYNFFTWGWKNWRFWFQKINEWQTERRRVQTTLEMSTN